MVRRLAIALAAVVAATAAAAFSNTPAEDPPNANVLVNGAFAAIAGANSEAAIALAFAPVQTPASFPAEIGPGTLAKAPATAPADTAPDAPAGPTVVITVDKSTQRMRVAVNGEQRWNWPVSTGRRGYATPRGTFRAFRMVRDHRSREWDNAPMPHSIFFTTRGHAIHGSFATGRLGSPASAGCVRLAPNNARQLFALVQQHGMSNTVVVIAGTEQAPVYARGGATSKSSRKAHARTPKSQAAPKAPPQRLAQQTAHRLPPSHQPLQVVPRGFAPPVH